MPSNRQPKDEPRAREFKILEKPEQRDENGRLEAENIPQLSEDPSNRGGAGYIIYPMNTETFAFNRRDVETLVHIAATSVIIEH